MTLDRNTLVLSAWSVLMSVTAQVLLRTAMAPRSSVSGMELFTASAVDPLVWAGIGLYLLGTVSYLAVLSRIDLAVAYPLGAMSYVLVTILGATVLDERVTLLRWVGTASILLGILVVARGERRVREEPT